MCACICAFMCAYVCVFVCVRMAACMCALTSSPQRRQSTHKRRPSLLE